MDEAKILKNIDEKITALLVLSAYKIEKENELSGGQKVEVLLNRSGFSPSQISKLLGKKLDTVIKTINRAKK